MNLDSIKRPLRIGLLLDSLQQPQWVYRIVADIQASAVAEVVLLIVNKPEAGAEEVRVGSRSPGDRIGSHWRNRRHLLYNAYTRLDNSLFKVERDAFAMVNIESLVADVPVARVAPVMTKHTDTFPAADIETISGYDLDVALRFGFRILKGDALGIARHGVWSYHHGDGSLNRGGPPGFWEVMTDAPVTGSMLQVLTEELDNGKIIHQAWATTVDKFSVNRNRNHFYWKSAAYITCKLEELHATGELMLADRGEESYKPYYQRLYKQPTNVELLPLLARKGVRYLAGQVRERLTTEQWGLAYRFKTNPTDENNTFYKFKTVTPPLDKFWADPFPVKTDDNRYYIFLEEYLEATGKGHISVMEVTRKEGASTPVKVLERDYHLSYPFIFEWQGTRYMIPETGANRSIELYRCRAFPYEWEFECTLMENVRAADATLAEIDGRWWMFVSIAAEGAALNCDELYLFHATTPLGPWQPHRRNPVKSDARSSRPAGALFRSKGRLLRPSQNCAKHYGYGITINEIVRLDESEFVEKEVAKILPEWRAQMIGTHTLNTAEDLTVTDCLMRRRKR
jgi:hypothetical protein